MSSPVSSPISREIPSSGVARLDALDDEQLDALPYGVMCLDRDAKILRYNLAEARFARLDRAQVIGRNFFAEIAPCTATPAFQGRFETFVANGGKTGDRFRYVFDFRFGAQEVDVELARGDGERIYLLVNRKRLLPPRPEVPSAQHGALQAALAPAESKQGVVRDVNERRLVQVSPILFEALFVTMAREQVSPKLLESWGFAWGRLAAVDMETEALEVFERLLRELPMVTLAELIAQHMRRQGWGQLGFDFAHARDGAFVVTIARNALAEAVPPGPANGPPRCALFAGFLRAVLSHVTSRRVAVVEARCIAQGAPRCELVVVGEGRRGELERAALPPRSADEVIATLARGK